MAIEKTFTSLDDALNAGAGAGKRDPGRLTLIDKAAVSFVMANVPPELKAWFDKGFSEHFPDLVPSGTNEQGQPMYSAATIAKVLGADVGEINEICASMLGKDESELEPLAGCH